MEHPPTDRRGTIVLSEGTEVYGSDGERWGRVEDVGAKYLKVVEGLLGNKEWYVPGARPGDGCDARRPAADGEDRVGAHQGVLRLLHPAGTDGGGGGAGVGAAWARHRR